MSASRRHSLNYTGNDIISLLSRLLAELMTSDKPVSMQDLMKQLVAVRSRLANIYKSIEMGVELDDQFLENLNGLKNLRQTSLQGSADQRGRIYTNFLSGYL